MFYKNWSSLHFAGNAMSGSYLLLTLTLLAGSLVSAIQRAELIYGYECQASKCVKVELSEANFDKAISLPVCHMFCGDEVGNVWPRPTGKVVAEPLMLHIDENMITYKLPVATEKSTRELWMQAESRFKQQLEAMIPNRKLLKAGGHALQVEVTVTEEEAKSGLPRLTLDTDESYVLRVDNENPQHVVASVTAKTYFGARHGLETLAQLFVYDDIRREVQLLGKAEIHDAPAYKWRGLLLDTSRNFYSTKAIKRMLDGMAMVKLNTFHWHITDTHSFPLEVKSHPSMAKLGAYSPRKVYSHKDIANIVEYGLVRGIRVMPELDAPAHVGEGWQHTNMTACFRAQPWTQYCVEPPCGQLDPTVDALYTRLQDIYGEMQTLFNPDVFHMGGDEVNMQCWNSSQRIKDWMLERGWGLQQEDFMRLWNEFQQRALASYDQANPDQTQQTPIVLWTSHLTQTPYIDQYLNKSRYIIQVWTLGNDPQVQQILKRGFRIIVSNYDALYFDCGGPGWVQGGNNWCSPYIGWQLVYDNNLQRIAGDYNSLVLGSEAVIWSEQIDEQSLDARLWPRASALAEQLWTQPREGWRSAESRMLLHRERLVENGLAAESLQPEWCLQNEGDCPITAGTTSN